jgi:hypothetical protein
MKNGSSKLFLLVLILVTGFNLRGQGGLPADTAKSFKLSPVVDKRVELLSIVFRLAGNQEYNANDFKSYVTDINTHFTPYKKHPLIVLAHKLAQEKGISYDAVMFMAIHINQSPFLTPIIPFKQRVPEARWKSEDAEKFISLLQQFYRDAKCEDFFQKHSALYALAESRFDSVLRNVDMNWFEAYYGKLPEAKFNLVLGLGNGGGNYGPKIIFQN